MSLTNVKISEEVWLTCLTHALSTETEEIMGLLLGDGECSKNGNLTALIWGASPQTRSDRQKDRVETNPEQLAAASAQAERMTISTGRTTRVIGWYHSHPHITVLPSHVDVRTQAMYQLLDSGFIGLIFSCFSEDINKVGRIQVIAFQSSDGKQTQSSVRPVPLSPGNRNSVIDIESSLSSSENTSIRSGSIKGDNPEEDTGNSRATKGRGKSSDLGGYFANSDTTYLGREIIGGNFHNGNSSSPSFVDIDPMNMSEGMQEAMHRSNLDMSAAEYVRKEIPLHVVPGSSLLKLDSPLRSFTDLQRVIYEEEKAAYLEAMGQNIRDGRAHPLTFIHHTSTYQASMCKLIEHWNSVIDIESSLSSSENTSIRSGSIKGDNPEEDTGNSRATKGRGKSSDLGGYFANSDTTYLGREIIGGNFHNGNSSSPSFVDIDPMNMSEGMQEAMHRSNLDMSAAEYVRKEIPLHVVPGSSLLKLDSPLRSFTDLQRVIYEEEKAAYLEAMGQNIRDGRAHPLTFIHHTSTYQASMCKLIEHCLSPAICALHDRLRENEIRMATLVEEAKNLEMEAIRSSDSTLRSIMPHTSRGTGSYGYRNTYGPSEMGGTVRATGNPSSRGRRGS